MEEVRRQYDLSATKVLRDDLVASAQQLGAVAFDATEALAAAEPGAFLDADLHLTPKGHAALAAALVGPLAQPRPAVPPSVLPEGARCRPLTMSLPASSRSSSTAAKTRAVLSPACASGCRSVARRARRARTATCCSQTARSAPSCWREAMETRLPFAASRRCG